MKRYVKAADITEESRNEEIDAVFDEIQYELKHNSEHFINDDGDDCFAIYEDDAVEIVERYRKLIRAKEE